MKKRPATGNVLVQARISRQAHEKLAQLAEKETRSIANCIERIIYERLGIVAKP